MAKPQSEQPHRPEPVEEKKRAERREQRQQKTPPAEEWGQRHETGKTIDRGGKEERSDENR